MDVVCGWTHWFVPHFLVTVILTMKENKQRKKIKIN